MIDYDKEYIIGFSESTEREEDLITKTLRMMIGPNLN